LTIALLPRATESKKIMKRIHVIISGRVQGVFFRGATQRAAMDFNLTSWVRNTADGRVEAVFEGEDKNVDKMIAWCHIGPPHARVENVTIKEEPYIGEFRDFSIRY
jgi:acylphosphatase